MSSQEALPSSFELEVVRLLTENNKTLKENQTLMKENKVAIAEVSERLRKIVINTSGK